MTRQFQGFTAGFGWVLCCLLAAFMLAGCKKQDESGREAKEAPPSTPAVVATGGSDFVKVDKPEQFPLIAATSRDTFTSVIATGSVNPDVSTELPVLSLANGRVVSLFVKLGDTVHKGQAIMTVQSPDVATAFDTYVKAVNDEHLTKVTLDRDKLLYGKGAIPQTQLEAAQNGEDDAIADLKASEQQLRILGVDRNHPSDTVTIYAPTSGVVVTQNTTAAAAAGVTLCWCNRIALIADLSHVWIICDVYENDLAQIHMGEQAEIHLAAYPDKVLKGTIADIGAVLDPSIRTAKVRIQVPNPGGIMRLGMFASATFQGSKPLTVAAVPADAILHLHDRAFVFEPADNSGTFRTVEIKTGKTVGGNLIEVLSRAQPWSTGRCQCVGAAEHGGPVMIRKIVDFALNNRLIVILLALGLFIWGAISFHNLPCGGLPRRSQQLRQHHYAMAGPLRGRGGATDHRAA